MEKMKEQYLAEIQNGYCKEGEWWNAKYMLSMEGRYCKTKEEAQEWINKAIENGQRLATKKHVMGTPPFSIEFQPNEKDLVKATRIRKRMVTEWEEA